MIKTHTFATTVFVTLPFVMIVAGLFNPAYAKNADAPNVNTASATTTVVKRGKARPLGGQRAADNATARENAAALARIKAVKVKAQVDAANALAQARKMVTSGKLYASSNDPRNCDKVIQIVGETKVPEMPVLGKPDPKTYVITEDMDEYWACDVTPLDNKQIPRDHE